MIDILLNLPIEYGLYPELVSANLSVAVSLKEEVYGKEKKNAVFYILGSTCPPNPSDPLLLLIDLLKHYGFTNL